MSRQKYVNFRSNSEQKIWFFRKNFHKGKCFYGHVENSFDYFAENFLLQVQKAVDLKQMGDKVRDQD